MAHEYSNPKWIKDPHKLPDVEVFHLTAADGIVNEEGEPLPTGYYWWSCFPGCMPEGEPTGPFDTYTQALADARS